MAQHWTEAPLVGFEGLAEARVIDGAMVASEARACIERVKGHWQAFWFELKDFHDREGWRALNYRSFSACVTAELDMPRQHVYRLLEAASIRLELADAFADEPEPESCHPGVTTLDHMTERQARELAPLPPPARVEIARRTDFRETSAPQLRETVSRAKAALERLDDQEPDWDAIATNVGLDGQLLDAKLREDFSKAIDRTLHGLLEIDPAAAIPLLEGGDREHTELFLSHLRQWCDAAASALAETNTIRMVGRQ